MPSAILPTVPKGRSPASSSSRLVSTSRVPVSAGDADQTAFSVPSSFCVALPWSKPLSWFLAPLENSSS